MHDATPARPQREPGGGDGHLDNLSATTARTLAEAERLAGDMAELPAPDLLSDLETLIDQLVRGLVPLMGAEEDVLCPRLEPALGDALRRDHAEVRRLAERLAMLSQRLEQHLRRASDCRALRTALKDLTVTLDRLLVRQQALRRQLIEKLPIGEQQLLVIALETAEAEARQRTILILRPEIPSTTAHHLRSRPDLDVAYPMSLAALERRSAVQGPGIVALMEARPRPLKGDSLTGVFSHANPVEPLPGDGPAGKATTPSPAAREKLADARRD